MDSFYQEEVTVATVIQELDELEGNTSLLNFLLTLVNPGLVAEYEKLLSTSKDFSVVNVKKLRDVIHNLPHFTKREGFQLKKLSLRLFNIGIQMAHKKIPLVEVNVQCTNSILLQSLRNAQCDIVLVTCYHLLLRLQKNVMRNH
jgi:hypothetical protein